MARPSLDSFSQRLPLVTLYLTERCNSRCVGCDHWRRGRTDLTLAMVRQLIEDLEMLGTRVVALSGGEPLLHPEWAAIAELLGARGFEPWLLTSGLALAKHAGRVARLFAALTVSLDGTDAPTYAATRGLDAFEPVCEGIRRAAAEGLAPTLRVTLQRANFRQLPEFVLLAHQLRARQVSFLAVDVSNPQAFGRAGAGATVGDLTLHHEDLSPFAALIDAMERTLAADFESGFIAESPAKLRRIAQQFAARLGVAPPPLVRCNAPEFSAVVDARGQLHPCFFIAGPPEAHAAAGLPAVLASEAMAAQRAQIRAGGRPECATCVCSMWRDLSQSELPLMPARSAASPPT